MWCDVKLRRYREAPANLYAMVIEAREFLVEVHADAAVGRVGDEVDEGDFAEAGDEVLQVFLANGDEERRLVGAGVDVDTGVEEAVFEDGGGELDFGIGGVGERGFGGETDGGGVAVGGEDFGGSQHRHLIAVFEGYNGGFSGNNGLAAAHVALEEAVHGAGARHVAGDFAQHPLLSPGGFEGQQAFDLFPDPVVQFEADTWHLAGLVAL